MQRLQSAHSVPVPTMIGHRQFVWGERPAIMGIVNVTPDSFSDGGQFVDLHQSMAHVEKLLEEGADILDVGGESTRPGSLGVSAEEELRRVVPLVKSISKRFPSALISIDTSKAEVARAAIAEGASMVNDVTAFGDRLMAKVVAESGVTACLMHMRGTPRTMQDDTRSDDLMAEIIGSLGNAVACAEREGIAKSKLIVDPGIGFGKSASQNFYVLNRLGDLRCLGLPILIGASRKSFLKEFCRDDAPSSRKVASAAVAAVMASRGSADIFRVHDVAMTREAVGVAYAIRSASAV